MILHHIAQSTGLIVEAPTTLDAHILYCGNLNSLDVIAIPQWLEDPISEAQSHDVLHSLLTEEVIDTIELMFAERLTIDLVQLHSRLEIIAKGLLNDNTANRLRLSRSILFALLIEPHRS